ncbi:hypothetical protein SARC_12951 [Sphaeroforma arctica JP610]|uniref:GST N-terminal domain-containing protein n=1 Tax=Sphaeroforma arctica JP610 TaxID=667725 RepID=A0A0L0FEM4_9EUKA|nr:hypothetical protein SARC_12951 [Sphaeroforma arctica JP610]KNC74508.1 hypothetical protein SARC_12951 [Sphaeroforma arctica JP610]|eukprot:XP_014148410.1 hypothetical protein SARC_12951 [Sphaeroforma arctica JP610]
MSLAGIAIGARRCMLPTISACRGYATSSQKGLNQNNVKSHLSLTTSARFTKSHFAGVAGLVSALVGWRLFSIAAHAEAPFKGESETKAEPEIILYQYDPCPFCNKVRAYMDYHNIEYKVVEVNPMGKKEMAFTDYKKVPLAMINGEEVRDSVRIIDYLQNQRKDLGKTTVQRFVCISVWCLVTNCTLREHCFTSHPTDYCY